MADPSAIQQLQLEQAGIYVGISTEALYLFECLITFSQEVEVIWRRQWSSMTWVYAFTRYSSVSLFILDLIPGNGFVECKVTQYVVAALDLIQFLCFACFSALRVYALLDGKKLIAVVVFFLNLVPFAINMHSYVTSIVFMDSEVCAIIVTSSEELVLRLSLATRIAVIIGDVLVLLVTWSKTAQLYRESRRLGIKAPLAALLFRDGTFYFVILLIMNIFQVTGRNIPTLLTLDLSSQLLETFTPIIICRFTLDLRQVKSPGSSWVSGNQSASLRFVGNAGGSLRFGLDEDEEGEEDGGEHLSQAELSGISIAGKEEHGGTAINNHAAELDSSTQV